jgi:DNA-binding NarL/FixJ family response regulator
MSALLAFVSELRRFDDPVAFAPRLLSSLGRLVSSDQVTYSEVDPRFRSWILRVWHLADGKEGVRHGEGADDGRDEDPFLTERWWRLRGAQPTCCYRNRSGDYATPLKVSDFVTLQDFQRTPICEVFHRGEVVRWMDVGLPATDTKTSLFTFTRVARNDFDERDRLVLALLQPHLVTRADEARAASDAAHAFATILEGADDDADRVVLCSRNGVIEFGSARSRALLTRYLALSNGRIPSGLLGRRQLVVVREHRRLTIRIARADALYVLLLAERDTRSDRLTTREREVLGHVARGQENDAIAQALGIAPATVAKHLEHVYAKLGVRNRTGAVTHLND